MKASIVIRTRNEGRKIRRLLDSIFSQTVDFEYEVIIIDTESEDDTLAIASEYPLNVINILQKDFNYPKSCNIGVNAAKGQIVIFISGHAYPMNNLWLKSLVNGFDNENIIAVTGPLYVCPEHQNNPFLTFYNQHVYNKNSCNAINIHLTNVNAAYKKDLLLEVPFDEKIPFYSEEKFWKKKILDMYPESKILKQYEAKVYHSHNPNIKSLWFSYYMAGKANSYSYLEGIRLLSVLKKIIINSMNNLIYYKKSFSKINIFWYLKIPLYHAVKNLAFYKGHNYQVKYSHNGNKEVYNQK